jgi:hypothetical protein
VAGLPQQQARVLKVWQQVKKIAQNVLQKEL